jgi:hypothetical protein
MGRDPSSSATLSSSSPPPLEEREDDGTERSLTFQETEIPALGIFRWRRSVVPGREQVGDGEPTAQVTSHVGAKKWNGQ